jgi:flagellar biosynthetic protein FliR
MDAYGSLTAWVVNCLLLSLRLAPVFSMAPPFTLARMPPLFRALSSLALAAVLVSANPQAAQADLAAGALVVAAARELALGLTVALAFHVVFGALYFAGRTVDIQAGHGLALLIDPTSRAQTPLVGTLFAYAAGAVFFAADGHVELFRLLSAQLQLVPVGGWIMPATLAPLTAFVGLAFALALGVAGASVLALFLVDVVIALLSRTVPQMNALIMGFQVKTIVLLLVLPVSFGLGGALLARLMGATLQALPRML